MKKKWVGTLGAMLMAATLAFSGSTAVFADEKADNQVEDMHEAYVEDIHGQDEIVNNYYSSKVIEKGQGYVVYDSYTRREVNGSKQISAPRVIIYIDELKTDLNVFISEILSKSYVTKDSMISCFSKMDFTVSEDNLKKIKEKGVVLNAVYSSENHTGTRNPYFDYEITRLDNISGDYTPSLSVNTDTKAINTLKVFGVNKFFTLTLNDKYGKNSLGNGIFLVEIYKNIGNFEIDSYEDGEDEGNRFASDTHSYYYNASANRFTECDKDNTFQGCYEYRATKDVSSYLQVNADTYKMSGTYVVTQGELPKAALMDTYTGLVNEDGNWLYYNNGKADPSYTGLCKYNDSWWYVKNGKVDFSYTGLYKYNGTWWYLNGGKINFSATGLCKYNGSWWYVRNGKIDFSSTTLCKYNGSWWYVSGGKVNFSATGLCKYNGSWWYVKNGKVDFSATGLCKYNGSWWYVKNGKIDFSATTLCKYNGNWFYVNGGKVSFTTTLCKYNGVWWYIENGVVNFSRTTLVKYGSNWYAVAGGKVAWGYTGKINYNGAAYNVVGGVVKF